MSKSERILAVIIVALSVALIAGTAWGLMTDAPGRKKARQAVPSSVSASGVYDGIARVRAATADGAVVIVHIAFPYDSQDRQFREELAARRMDMKATVKDYLSGRTAADLHPSNENTVKAALRDTMNSMLVFGRIEELYFAEFEVIP